MERKPKTERQNKVNQSLTQIISDFINQNSNRQSLITVTRCDVAPNLSSAIAYISILPDEKEGPGLDFLKRKERDLFEFAKKKSELRKIPKISFAVDHGEKNRQRINQLSMEIAEQE